LSRGISENTVNQFKITQSDTYFAQIGGKTTSINFNYFRGGELVNIKHRAVDKKAFGLEKGCELVLYNLDNVEQDKDYVFITEGEIDTLTLGEFYQSPKNILSVPNGASTGRQQKLNYLDSAVESKVFEGKKLYLFFDNDQAGKLLTDAFINRFGAHKCLVPVYPDDCKDINDVLITYGLDGVSTVLESFKYTKISGITDVSNFEHKIWDYWKNGYPKGDRIGLKDFDPLLSFRGGELTMVTGISGSGKSEFLDYIMVQLAKRHNWKWAVCSMENPGDIHTTKIIEKCLGTNLTDIYDSETGELFYEKAEEDKVKEALSFSYNYFNYIEYAITVEDGETHRSVLSIDYILDQAKKLVSMYGTKGLVIDPWNTIEHDLKNNETETNYVSRILSKIIAFAEDYNVHVFLVAHPTKGVTINGVDRVATLNDISGSGNFFNKTHNGISVFRKKDKDKNPDNLIEVHVQKVKFKFVGTLGACKLEYNILTGNYFDTDKDYPQNNN
jgi:twinkle protein